jgi:hypothetical protein
MLELTEVKTSLPTLASVRSRSEAMRHNYQIEWQQWAVRVIRHQGLIIKDAAPCTFLHEGRIADFRCEREIEGWIEEIGRSERQPALSMCKRS